jgi:maltooligosyltrehalose trehalohydrolase
MQVGALCLDNMKCQFVVWAPLVNRLSLKIVAPEARIIPMEKDNQGYWKITLDGMAPNTSYFYQLNEEKDRPDPASPFQPQGVHSFSQVVDHGAFRWKDQEWSGLSLDEMIVYELHVGTFTPEGTFGAVIERLDALCELGINTISLMPVAQFPGERNWGYDGVFPYAVHNTYGGPDGLKQLVDACHERRIAVVLDVVYNHLGPEGNYLSDFGPYFTSTYRNPWGKAINFDQAYSDEVRNFFIENALYWFRQYHIDGLRLDAVHGIYDFSAKPFLQELSEKAAVLSEEAGRTFYLIAESDLNDVRVLNPPEQGGFGLDAQWCDDFHHALHAVLTSEKQGYYADFGDLGHLVKSLKEGYVLSWQYSKYRKRHHGSSSRRNSARQFMVFSQNHDQVGNRMCGERLARLVSFEGLKLAAGVVLLSPYIPLLFMGEEYAEEAPFLYFVDHSDPDLISAVREGRAREFQAFQWEERPPDPQILETFVNSRLRWEQRREGKHGIMLRFYKRLIEIRKKIPALYHLKKENIEVEEWKEHMVLLLRQWYEESEVVILMNFNQKETLIHFRPPPGKWQKILESSHQEYRGPGQSLPGKLDDSGELSINPLSFALYQRKEEG